MMAIYFTKVVLPKMLKTPQLSLKQQTSNRVLYLSAIILSVTLLALNPTEYERFSSGRWTIALHNRDTLALQAKYCPNSRIRDNSALYMFRGTYRNKKIVVFDEDSISPLLLRNTISATQVHKLSARKRGLEGLLDSGLLYRSFPVFTDPEESLVSATEISLVFEKSSERWLFMAL